MGNFTNFLDELRTFFDIKNRSSFLPYPNKENYLQTVYIRTFQFTRTIYVESRSENTCVGRVDFNLVVLIRSSLDLLHLTWYFQRNKVQI